MSKLNKKMLSTLNTAYQILRLWGYYDGIEKVSIVQEGFEEAYKIIETINP